MKKQVFDIIVIGAGSGGLNIAGFMNKAGFRVLLIDKDDESIGGDCLNFGCVPSKALLHASHQVAAARSATRYGVNVEGAVSWSAVRDEIQRKQVVFREHESKRWFESQGMTVTLGEAQFVDHETVTVNGELFSAKRIVVATGSRPRPLTAPGVEQVTTVLNNESVFTMKTLPKTILIVGAGPIGIEMAQAFAQLGSTIIVVDPGQQILNREDKDVASIVQSELEKLGIVFRLGVTLDAFTGPTAARVTYPDGQTEVITFDAIFTAIGRIPNTETLAVEKAGVTLTSRGYIEVNNRLQTRNPRVFACGDVAGNFQFTHAAEVHAGVIISNFFSPFKKTFNPNHMAWTTFTNPEVATFGRSVRELTEEQVSFRTITQSFVDDDRAIVDDYRYGLTKVHVSPQGIILGGTMVAPQAGELVQELILLMVMKRPITTLFTKVYSYPVATRINKRLVTVEKSKQLTTFTRKLLRFLY